MRRASRSSSFMSGKLALEPLRVRWARLGRTSFAPLGGWAGSRPSSSPVSVLPFSHARCALRRARRPAPRHPSLLGVLALALAQLPHLRRAWRARGKAARSSAPSETVSLSCLLDRYDAAAPRVAERHLLARATVRALARTRVHAHTHRATCAQVATLAPRRAPCHTSVFRRASTRSPALPRPDGRCSAGAAPSRVDKSLDLSLPKGSGSRRAPFTAGLCSRCQGQKRVVFRPRPPPPFRVPLWS